MKRGDQIVYVPDNAKGKPWTQKSVEYGFVHHISSYNNESIFCRYWIKGQLGVLRTTANSESTNLRDLVLLTQLTLR